MLIKFANLTPPSLLYPQLFNSRILVFSTHSTSTNTRGQPCYTNNADHPVTQYYCDYLLWTAQCFLLRCVLEATHHRRQTALLASTLEERQISVNHSVGPKD